MKRSVLTSILSFALLIPVLVSCGGSSTTPSTPSDQPQGDSSKVSAEYICPCGHCGYEGGPSPGECPKCGMELEHAKK